MSERAFFAACTRGLEPALEHELAALGARRLERRAGGVAFRGEATLGPAACLWLRSAIRVQEVLVEAVVRDERDLYATAHEVPWERTLSPDGTLAVDASVRDAALRHSGYAAQLVKDGLVDRFRDHTGRRPDVDTADPDLPIKLLLRGQRATLYRELAGASLHKRGYRPVQVKSPLNEATAAGLLLLSGWDRTGPVLDPLCGSATFLIEAALIACDRAPGLERGFAFERWLDHDRRAWDGLRRAARERARPTPPFPLEGADHHAGAVSLARKAVAAAGLEAAITLSVAEVARFHPRQPPAAVFVNPPWGERLGEGEALESVWRDLGAFLRGRCGRTTAWVLSGNPALTRHLRLKADRRWPVRVGPIDARLLRYGLRSHAPGPGSSAGP